MKHLAPLFVLASIASLCQPASAQGNFQVTVSGAITTNDTNFLDVRYNTASPGSTFTLTYEVDRTNIGGGGFFEYALAQTPTTFTVGTTVITTPTPSGFLQTGFVALSAQIGSRIVQSNDILVDLGVLQAGNTLFMNPDLVSNGNVIGSGFGMGMASLSIEGDNGNPGSINATVQTINILVPIGTPYCVSTPNSTGVSGRMLAFGSIIAANNSVNNVTFVIDRLPASSFGLALVSASSAVVPPIGSNVGTLCLGGSIGRYNPPFQTDAFGLASVAVDLTSTPPLGTTISAGQTWFFQAWHRDSSASGTSISNYTTPVMISFQ